MSFVVAVCLFLCLTCLVGLIGFSVLIMLLRGGGRVVVRRYSTSTTRPTEPDVIDAEYTTISPKEDDEETIIITPEALPVPDDTPVE